MEISKDIIEIFNDVHYFEYGIEDITPEVIELLKENVGFDASKEKQKKAYYSYAYLIGKKGYIIDEFHSHGSVLLAEFHGKKVVFLAEPGAKLEKLGSEETCIEDRFIRILSEEKEAFEQTDTLLKIKNNNYVPFQK